MLRSKNMTYGYELLVNPESSHNSFRLIMCCDIDMERLNGNQLFFSIKKSNSRITIMSLCLTEIKSSKPQFFESGCI